MDVNDNEVPKKKNFLVRTIVENKIFITIIILIIFVRFFILSVNEVVNISMMPTLEDGDIVVVDNKIYNLTGLDRFDIVIFKYQISSEEKFLIKRVVGLPGETLNVTSGKLYVNGEEVIVDDEMQKLNEVTPDFNTGVIPDDMYFVLGDNRLNSIDSRTIGTISNEDILGHVLFRIKPFNKIRFLTLAF